MRINWEGPIAAVVLTVCGLGGIGYVSLAASRDFAAMKAEYKRPAVEPLKDQVMVELGRQLFWDPRVSASGKTACVTCHLPYLGCGGDRQEQPDGLRPARSAQVAALARYGPSTGLWLGRATSIAGGASQGGFFDRGHGHPGTTKA